MPSADSASASNPRLSLRAADSCGSVPSTGKGDPAKNPAEPAGTSRFSTTPSAPTNSSDGPYSSDIQKRPSGSAAMPSVSAPSTRQSSKLPSSASAGSVSASGPEGAGRPDKGSPEGARKGTTTSSPIRSPTRRNRASEGPIEGIGNILARSVARCGTIASTP